MSKPKSDPVVRFWVKVDKSGECWEWTAFKDRKGYGKFQRGFGSEQYAHRIAYLLSVGPIEAGMLVDHRCHNHGCVRPEHLRQVTNKENLENLAGASRNSRSGIRGVHWRTDTKAWQALVRHDGKRIHVGYFASLEEAEAAVIAKRVELFTHNDLDRVGA